MLGGHALHAIYNACLSRPISRRYCAIPLKDVTMMDDLTPGVFRSWRSYWTFARSVSRELRYVRTPATEHFLESVLRTSLHRQATIPAGQRFWRAQLGHDWRPMSDNIDDGVPCAYSKDRMKPLPDKAWDGRANPRGIPCLYLATSKETAMSEVRPWIGSYVSVGQFRTCRDLSVIDCARHHGGVPLYLGEPDEPEPEDRTDIVWKHIDLAFAEPMTRSDDNADYAPTQILAELFKRADFGGLVYRSNFGAGSNLALFNINDADLINCGLYKVEKMQASFRQTDQFYHVAEQPDEPTATAGI